MTFQAVHFLADFRIGGPHNYAKSMCKVAPNDVDTVIVTVGVCSIGAMSLIHLRHRSRWLFPLELFINILQIIYFFRSDPKRIKIFCVHGSINIAPLIAALFLRIPVIWILHETGLIFRPFVNFGMMILRFLPHQLAIVAESCKGIIGKREATFLPGGVDTTFWKCAEDRVESQAIQITFVGNMNPSKGLDLLLEALRSVDGNWQLRIIGSELSTHQDYYRSLKISAEALCRTNPECAVDFLGWCDASQIFEELSVTDVFVMPSKTEACPLALLEAMSMECYCIATPVGDINKIIPSAIFGDVVESTNSGEIAEAINRYKRLTIVERQKIGSAARQRVMENYSMASLKNHTEAVYNSLLQSIGKLS